MRKLKERELLGRLSGIIPLSLFVVMWLCLAVYYTPQKQHIEEPVKCVKEFDMDNKIPLLYHYRAVVTKAYDGDTITVDLDVGMGVWIKGQKIRLYGIDTPEIRGDSRPEGIIARDYVRDRILNSEIILQTIKDKKGKYGRWLGIVYYCYDTGDDGTWVNLNEELVTAGQAVRYIP